MSDALLASFYALNASFIGPKVEANGKYIEKQLTVIFRYGPSELSITGSLRNWTIIPDLHKIKVPTLLINGSEDEAQDVAMQPFFDKIEKVKWITLDNAAHFSHVDQRANHMKHLQTFLDAE